jgi:hypothetical protein
VSVSARFLAFTSLLICLTLPRGAAAETDDEAERLRKSAPTTLRYERQEQRHGLQAARLSVTIASINVPYLAIWGSIWLPIARDESDPALRRRLYAIGPIQLAGAAANVAWLFFAGQSLRDYKHDGRKWMTVRRARLDTGLSGVDTALLIPEIVGGSIALVRNRDEKSSINRMTGLVLLVPNLALLPFHIWALVANGTELRHRKRGGELMRARRLQPIPSGFRF